MPATKTERYAPTQDELKSMFTYDCESGLFTRIKSSGGRLTGEVVGHVRSNGYIDIRINNVLFRAHRLAFLYVYGHFPEHEIDHINRNRSDNKLSNLRLATKSENMKNTKIRTNNKTGIHGVSPLPKGRWSVKVWNNGIKKHIGHFNDFFEACCARKSAELTNNYHYNHGANI